MRVKRALIVLLALAVPVFSGCRDEESPSGAKSTGASRAWWMPKPRIEVPAGAAVAVRLTSTLSSKTTQRGQSWQGVVAEPVIVGDRVAVATGSPVHGVVSGVVPAQRGNRAMLELTLETVTIDGRSQRMHAGSEPVVAGSPRARNLGAIAGGAAAGALIGKAVGGDGHDALIGGLVGGAAATGAVVASKGYQVVLKSGSTMTFTVQEPVAMR